MNTNVTNYKKTATTVPDQVWDDNISRIYYCHREHGGYCIDCRLNHEHFNCILIIVDCRMNHEWTTKFNHGMHGRTLNFYEWFYKEPLRGPI
jgi:hypothetical protein